MVTRSSGLSEMYGATKDSTEPAALMKSSLNHLKMDESSKLFQSINFFVYDSIKILFLLFAMIFVVGIIRSYISTKKIKRVIQKSGYFTGNLISSMFGAITPFCSCSSIPIFLSFIKAGIPLGVTFSFLVTSPLVNNYVFAVMLGFFGWKITLAYVISGIIIGVISGMVLGKMKLEKYLESDFANTNDKEHEYNNFKERVRFGISEAASIVKKLWHWILFGVALGAVVHNFVPDEIIHGVISNVGFFAIPLAVIIGVPMYGSCAAIIPIAAVLFQKGVPIGTALALMMAISALSFPEAVILRRAMKLRLILIFFGIVSVGIIILGYLFNFLQGVLV